MWFVMVLVELILVLLEIILIRLGLGLSLLGERIVVFFYMSGDLICLNCCNLVVGKERKYYLVGWNDVVEV